MCLSLSLSFNFLRNFNNSESGNSQMEELVPVFNDARKDFADEISTLISTEVKPSSMFNKRNGRRETYCYILYFPKFMLHRESHKISSGTFKY